MKDCAKLRRFTCRLGGPRAQVFCESSVSSLNVDEEPTAQGLNQTLFVRRRSRREVTPQVLHLSQQSFVLQEMRLRGFLGMRPHRELLGEKMEVCVFYQLIEQRVDDTVRNPAPNGSFKIIEQTKLARMLPIHRGNVVARFR